MKSRYENCALLFTCLFPSIATALYFLIIKDAAVVRIIYPALKVVQFGFPPLWLAFHSEEWWPRLRSSWRETLLSLCIGIIMATAVLFCYRAFLADTVLAFEVSQRIGKKLDDLHAGDILSFTALAFVISFLHSWLEEYYWRWFVFNRLQAKWPLPIALIIANLAFTAHHVLVLMAYLPRGTSVMVYASLSSFVFIAGVIWSLQFRRTQNVTGCWISHIAADLALMLIGFHLVWSYYS